MVSTGLLLVTGVLTGESEPGNRGPFLNRGTGKFGNRGTWNSFANREKRRTWVYARTWERDQIWYQFLYQIWYQIWYQFLYQIWYQICYQGANSRFGAGRGMTKSSFRDPLAFTMALPSEQLTGEPGNRDPGSQVH